MTLNQGEPVQTPLNLNALERWIEHELESYSTRTNTFRLDEMRQVIAELRAAREVLEAARELRDTARAKLKAGTFAPNPEMTDALLMLDESLDAYDRLTTSEDKAR